MVEAARIVEEAGPDLLDINFGCPVRKCRQRRRSRHVARYPKMLEITKAVVKAAKIPVTVKTRLGWDHDSRIIVDLAEQLQDCGIQALTVHGRTRSQMYTGQADWEMIARVKDNPRLPTIPLIGNGDITTPQRAIEAFDRYGVDGVMIGRASIGAPWIFNDLSRELMGLPPQPLSNTAKFRLLRRQITESIANIDEHRGILHIRRHLAASPLFKGIPNFRETPYSNAESRHMARARRHTQPY